MEEQRCQRRVVIPRKAHVSFEFGRGAAMRDPAHRLEGQGQHRRHLKLLRQGDIAAKEVSFYLQQAV